MNEVIKHRIDAIRSGEVPAGYKKVKIGVVPEDWKETHFKTMFSRLNRRNTTGNTNVLTISAQHGLISQEDFFNKSIASEDKSNYFLLKLGEFAYNKSYSNGYPFGAIKPLVAYESGIVSPLYICFSASKENKCPEYYTQYFEGGLMNHEIQAFAQEGARNHGLLNISVGDFFNAVIVAPPLPEQQRIAKILSAQDKVIELKEKRIAEKQRQKKYLMQQLLTGKKRLKGFSGEWDELPISKLLTERNTQAPKDENYPLMAFVANVGISAKGERYDRSALINDEENKLYKRTELGDFIYSSNNLEAGSIGLNKYGAASISPVYSIFKPTTNTVSDYVGMLLTCKEIIGKMIKYRQGVIYGQWRIHEKDFLRIKVSVPPLAEQNAIANILSTADNEISLLKEELEQEKLKKKSLMQLLLTGIVRVSA